MKAESPWQCPLESSRHTYPNPATGQHHKRPLCQESCWGKAQVDMEVEVDSGAGEDHGWTDGGRWGNTTLGQQIGMGISRRLEGISWGKSTEVGEDGRAWGDWGQMSSVSLPYL